MVQFKIGLVICALLGLFDVATVGAAGAEDGPPVPVIVLSVVFGIITLVAVWFAWRGSQGGFIAIVVSRVLSVLLGLPVFFMDDIPDWVPVATIIATVITAIAVALLVSGRRQAATAPAT